MVFVAATKSNAENDATVLLTGTHVDRLSDALRGANISINRLESAIKDLIKSNEKVAESNKELIEALRKELIKALRREGQSNNNRKTDR